MRVVPFKNIIPTCSLLEHALDPALEDIMVKRYGIIRYSSEDLKKYFRRSDVPIKEYMRVCHNLAVLNRNLMYTFDIPEEMHKDLYLRHGCIGASILDPQWRVKLKYLREVVALSHSVRHQGKVYPAYLWLGKYKHITCRRSI